jgi:2-polyprenyl-3-methyl-5-hydroxy-6-metoxy-1,4-benzoquinol methylase
MNERPLGPAMTNRKERRAARKPAKSATMRSDRPVDAPNIVDALLSRGKELRAKGDEEAALLVACRTIQMEETPATKAFFIQSIKGWSSFPGAEVMQPVLARALREAWAWPAELLIPVMGILEKDSLIGPAIERANRAWPRRLTKHDLLGPNGLAAIAKHPLLSALLESIAIPDLRFERFLTTLRCAVLDVAASACDIADDQLLRFASALAQQCFINEYVFDVTSDERRVVTELQQAICAAAASGSSLAPLQVAAIAAYVRLDSLPLRPLWRKSWPSGLLGVINQQIREPELLQRLRAEIPRLTPIADTVSLAVQHQYEENPYPRWIRSAAVTSPITLEAHLRQEFPGRSIVASNARPQLDVLVAGCGTGQQSIDLAQGYKGARVLAVDLSLSSLAYAKAQTAAVGLTNIEYAQADILELEHVGRTFDLIVSTGVLHHLADPIVGWRLLTSLLRPGGFMLLSLYSERARQDIVTAQMWAAAHGYGASVEDIRACRQELARIDDFAWRGIFTMLDFFSTSECRDLLFHVQEHRFTIPQIATVIEDNGLEFLGFSLNNDVRRRFKAQYPADEALADLRLWDAFEAKNPYTFVNMYKFWVRKPT